MNTPFEDRNGRKGVGSSGFSMPAPMTLEIWRRKRASEAGNFSADEPTVGAKPLFDVIVVEDGQSGGRLANPASANQSGWCETFCEANDLLD